MAEEVFIKVRLYSYGQSGAGSYLYYGSGLIGDVLVGKLGREINMNVFQNIETYF